MLCTGRSDNGPRGAGGRGARGQGPGARGLGPRASGVDSPRGRRPEGLGGRRVWLKAGPHDSPLRGGADSRRGPEERTLGEVRRSDSPRGPATPNIDSPRGRARPASADSQPPPTPAPGPADSRRGPRTPPPPTHTHRLSETQHDSPRHRPAGATTRGGWSRGAPASIRESPHHGSVLRSAIPALGRTRSYANPNKNRRSAIPTLGRTRLSGKSRDAALGRTRLSVVRDSPRPAC